MKKASALSSFRLILTVFCLVSFAQIKAQSPGGFGSGLSFWLKADGTVFQNVNGTGAVSNGSNVGSWRDQAASILLQNSAGEPPPIFRTDVSSAINFNPVVDFQGSHLANTTSVGAWTVFIVSQPDATNPLAPVISTPCSDYSCATRQIRVETGTNWYCCDGGDFGNIETMGYGTDGATGFTTAHLAYSQAGDLFVFSNGMQMGDTVTYPGANHRLWGRVAEVVVYNDVLSTDTRGKVQTYLALKYGLALNQNYTSSSGAVLWSLAGNTGYNNRITGVGRDDNSGLVQKQSTSTIDDELTVGIGTIAATNQLNAANPTNGKFMLWGHNDQDIYAKTLLATPLGAISHRSNKVYKISNNGMTDQVKLLFNLPLLDCVNPAQCKLLVSSDPDFTNPTVVNLQSNTATSLTFQTAAIANGSYVAIGYAITPDVPVITGNTQICSVNGSTTLTATGNLNAADNWYWSMTDCDGFPIATGPTLTVTAPGVYYVHGGSTAPGCFLFGPCASVTVTEFDPAPTATSNSAECPGQTIHLFGSGTSIVSWSWTGPAGFMSSQQNPSIPNATTANSGDYQLIVTDIHGCTASASVNVHIYAAPLSDAGSDQVLCNQTSTQMAAGTFGTWSIVSGSATIVDPFDPNTMITDLIPGTSVTLRLTVLSDPCSSFDEVTIFNNLNTNPAAAGPDQLICNVTTATMQGNPAGAGTGLWTLVSGTATIVTPASPATQVTGLQPGITVLRWTITPSNGCPVSMDEVQLTVGNPAPVIVSNSPLCIGEQLQMSASGNSINDYLWEGPASFASFDAAFVLDNVTAANAGAYTVTVTDIYGCTQSAVSTVVISALPTANAGPDQQFCSQTSTNMAASAANGTGVWSIVSGPGTIVTPGSANTLVTGLVAGSTTTLRWTVSGPGGACPVFDEVTIFNDTQGPTANAGPDQSLCDQTSTFISANDVAGLWTVVSGSATIVNPTEGNTQVTGLVPGTTVILRWTVTSGTCSNFDEMSISNNASPAPAAAGPDQIVCNTTSTALQGNAAGSGSGLWTLVSGTATIVTPALPTTQVTGLQPGITVLRWTITPSNGCPVSLDEVQLTVGNPAPVVVSNSPLCIGEQLQMSASGNSINDYLWEGPASFASFDAAFVLDNVTAANAGAYTVTVTDIYGCTQSAVSTVVISALPVANAGPDQQLCSLTSTSMMASAANGTGVWTKISGPGTIANPASPNTPVNNLVPGSNTTLRWTVSGPGGACPVFDEVVIFDGIPPAPANAGADQLLCKQFNTVVMANTPGNGTGMWSLVSGTATIIPAGSPTAEVLDLQAGITTLRWTITPDNGCPATQDEVQITVRDPQAGVVSSSPICEGQDLLMIASGVQIQSYAWSGPNGFTATQDQVLISPTTLANAGDYTVTVTDIAGCSESTTVTAEIQALPTANAGPDQDLCNQTSTQILANDVQGEWSVVSGTAVIANVNEPSTQVSGLIPGTSVTLRWTVNTVGVTICSAFDEMVITNNEAPTFADAGPDQSVCGTTATLAANTPGAGTGAWSIVSGAGVFSNLNDPAASVSGLAAGDNIFRWTISTGMGCPDALDEITVTSNGPLSTDAGPDQSICYDLNTTLNASPAPPGVTGTWSVVSGTAVFADANDAASAVSGLSPGGNVLRWSLSGNVGGCAQVFDDVSITVIESPGAPNAGPDQIACTKMATLDATPVVAGSGMWILANGSATIIDPSNPNTVVDDLIEGTTITLVWQVSNSGCPSFSDTMLITTHATFANPMAGADQEQCYDTNAVLSANAPPAGTTASWSVVSGSGNFSNINDPNTAVSGLSEGLNTLRWTMTDNSGTCPAVSDDVNVNVIPAPDPVDAGADLEACAGSTVLLGAASPDMGAGFWSIVSGNIQIAAINDPNSQATVNTAAVLLWNVSNGNCPAVSDTMAIQLAGPPAPADAGPDRSFCDPQEITMLAQDPPSGGSGQWTLVSGAGTLDEPSNPHSYVNGLGVGDNVFRWTLTSPAGACQTVFDEVTLTLLELPSPADAGADQTFCGDKAQLAAVVPAVGTGTWTIVSGNGTLSDPGAAAAELSGLLPGADVVLEWSVSNGACPIVNTDLVTIQVLDPNALSPADAGADQSLCYSSDAVLQASAPPVGTGMWSFVTGSGVFDAPTDPNSAISGLDYGVNVLQWNVMPGSGCPVLTDQVEITAVPAPDPALAGMDLNLCAAASATLSANTPVVGSGTWEILSGPGSIANPNDANSQITGLIPGSNTLLQWKTANGSCPFTPGDELLITNDLNPSIADAGIDIAICSSSTTLNAVPPLFGTGMWSIASGSGTLADPSQAVTSLNNLTPGTSIVVWSVSNGVCPVKNDTVSILSVNQLSAYAGPDQALCNATQTVLNAAAPGAGTGVWSIVGGSGTLGNPGANNSPLYDLPTGVPLTLQWTVSLPTCPDASDQIVVTVDPLPSTAEAGMDQTLCGITDAVLEATPAIAGTGVWSVLSGAGVTTTSTAPNSPVTGMTLNTPLVLQWTVSSGVCPPSTDQVTISPKALPSAAVAGADQALCNAAQAQLSATVPTEGQGGWHIVDGSGILVDPNAASTLLTNLAPGTGPVLVRWTVAVDGCPENNAEVVIQNDALPSTADAGANPSVCFSEVTLSAVPPVVGTGMWVVTSGTIDIQDPSLPNTVVSGLAQGSTANLSWVVSNGVCPSSSDDIQVSYYNGTLLNADFLINSLACVGDSFHIVEISDSLMVADTYAWDFGDGTYSSERDPVHTFTSAADYLVRLTATLGPCSTIMEKTVTAANCFPVENTGARAFAFGQVQPNPSEGPFRLLLKMNRTDQAVDITLSNSIGVVLEHANLAAEAAMERDFSLQTPGMYFLRVKSGKDQMVFKVVVVD